MKRLLLLLALCLLVGGASAGFYQTFQDTTGYVTSYGGTGLIWVQNNTGGNSYVYEAAGTNRGIINTNPEQTTYAAATLIPSTPGDNYDYMSVKLLDSSRGILWQPNFGSGAGVVKPIRVEVKIIGLTAYAYQDGVLKATSGVLAVNPSYIGFTSASDSGTTNNWDDYVYGAGTQSVVYDMPQQNVYIIKKDFLTPASSGFSYAANGTTIYSNILPTSWSKSAIGSTGGVNESIVLDNVFTGTVYATHYTGAKNTSDEPWDINAALINSGAPYGEYEIYMPNETGVHSIPIDYFGTGASVAFDKKTYSQGDTATITYSVLAGGYWNSAAYNYKLAIMNGNTGQFIQNQSISTQAGTYQYTWKTSDTQGTYYAIVIATPISGGADIWMNYDYTQVSGYITWNWCVNNETAMVQQNANVSMVQGSTVVNTVTDATGCGNSTGFLTGSTLSINVTKTGLSQYYVTMIPMSAHTIALNFTINATTPTTCNGECIGGVTREGTLTGNLITNGYGNPITSDTCYLRNATYGDSCTNLTNNAGWYQFDESNSCMLTSKRLYNVFCQKSGYSNSQNYTVAAA